MIAFERAMGCMEYLHLEVSNSVVDGKGRRVTHLREDGNAKKIEIFYEFDRIIPWSEHTVLDGHVFGVLLYAMSRGKPLKVHGAISHKAMRNLEELQLAWCRLSLEKYKKIDIIPEYIQDTRKIHTEEKAISAFSGGVDATFTALRHTKVLPDPVRYPLRSVLMVHGFDVDVYNFSAFGQLTKRVQPLLTDLNLELRTIRTNSRDLKIQDWDFSHGLELAACLHMYSDEFKFGLIGSSGEYNNFGLPWGSTPVLDHLMSGSELSVVHDGSGFCRTSKVSVIKDFPVACKTLKVCWAGVDQSGNCGKCEKCVRTQLNFLAAGVKKTPPCFPRDFSIDDLMNVVLNSESNVGEIESIVAYAKFHKLEGEWLKAADSRIADWLPADEAKLEKQKHGGTIKKILVKIVTCLGFGVPAKKLWRRLRRAVRKVVE